jgi:hypothetical protein
VGRWAGRLLRRREGVQVVAAAVGRRAAAGGGAAAAAGQAGCAGGRGRVWSGLVAWKKMKEKKGKNKKERIFLEYAIIQFFFKDLFYAMHFLTFISCLQVDPNSVLQLYE